MTSAGLRLLQLQREFNERRADEGLADEFRESRWLPRSEEEIAAEYEETLRSLLRA